MNQYVRTFIDHGGTSLAVDIECRITNGLPNVVIVGFAGNMVDEAKERIRGAFSSCGLQLPRRRVAINLAPADVPKNGSSLDVAMAIAVLCADSQLTHRPLSTEVFIGELGLDGTIRPVRGIIGKLLGGRAAGVTRFYIPRRNLDQARLIPGIELVAVPDLKSLCGHLDGSAPLDVRRTGAGGAVIHDRPLRTEPSIGLDAVIGQAQAKRALLISAAGGHNLLLCGPPGTGKSMLAKALAGLLPPMSREEMLEVTHLHSLVRTDYEQVVTARPFRSPHHSASSTAIIGGGARIRPGEISLSHHGVLFLDELPEFSRHALEALRQPLEDHTVNVSRILDSAEFPANFTLVATANPCPCGYAGDNGHCQCAAGVIRRYQQKLSGPLLDRIDLTVNVEAVEHSRLLEGPLHDAMDKTPGRLIGLARRHQIRRFGVSGKLNRDMDNRQTATLADCDAAAKALLDRAAHTLEMSARSYMRTIKVARTIADLDDSTAVHVRHISEALRYRPRAIFPRQHAI